MTAARSRPGALLALAFAALLLGGSKPLAAQDASEVRARWETGPVKTGWCVYFLMEPGKAAEDLARGHETVGVLQTEGWHPALRRLAESDATYANWVPSRVCQILFDTIWVGSRRYVEGTRRSPVGLGFWEVAARPSQGDGGVFGVARILATNSGDLKRRMETEFVPLSMARLTSGPIPDSRDERFEVELDRTTVTFDGHPVADSTLDAVELRHRFVVQGERLMLWTVELQIAPERMALFSGGLRFVGKGALAKAMSRSPIRIVGPVFSGGRAVVTFTR